MRKYRKFKKVLIILTSFAFIFQASLFGVLLTPQKTEASSSHEPSFEIEITIPNEGANYNLSDSVTVSGTVEVHVAAANQPNNFKVQIDWDDGFTTSGLEINVTSSGGSGNEAWFTGTWTTSPSYNHVYSSVGPKTIHARLYHGQPPGNDGEADDYATVNINIIDNTKPDSVAGPLSEYQNNLTFSVPYTASDDTSLKRVRLYKSTNGIDWDYHTYQNVPGSPTSYSGNFSFTAPSEGTYYFYTRAIDTSDNIEDAPLVADTYTTVDITAPEDEILINNDALYTNSLTVDLTLDATDLLSDVTYMRFSNDDSTWSSWYPYSSFYYPWVLASGPDGTRNVYVQYKDSAGNVSESFSDDIILDTTPPVISDFNPPNGYTTNNSNFSVRLTDNGSGIDPSTINPYVNYGAVGNIATWEKCTDYTFNSLTGILMVNSYPLGSLADGEHELYVSVKDNAENYSDTWNWIEFHSFWIVNIDTTGPEIFDNTPSSAVLGTPFSFDADVTDSGIGVNFVNVEYWFDGGSHTTSAMTGVGDNYSLEIIIPSASVNILHYIISAQDYLGNSSDSGIKDVSISEHGPAVSIDINPKSATITAGDSQAFQVTATDSYGNSWDVTGEANFDIDSGAGGSWSLNIYNSSNSGTWMVTVDYNGLTDSASLTVNSISPIPKPPIEGAGIVSGVALAPFTPKVSEEISPEEPELEIEGEIKGEETQKAEEGKPICPWWWIISLILLGVLIGYYYYLTRKGPIEWWWVPPVVFGIIAYLFHEYAHKFYEASPFCPWFWLIDLLIVIITTFGYIYYERRKTTEGEEIT